MRNFFKNISRKQLSSATRAQNRNAPHNRALLASSRAAQSSRAPSELSRKERASAPAPARGCVQWRRKYRHYYFCSIKNFYLCLFFDTWVQLTPGMWFREFKKNEGKN